MGLRHLLAGRAVIEGKGVGEAGVETEATILPFSTNSTASHVRVVRRTNPCPFGDSAQISLKTAEISQQLLSIYRWMRQHTGASADSHQKKA